MTMYRIGKTLKSAKSKIYDTREAAEKNMKKLDNLYVLTLLPHDMIGWRKAK